MKHDWKTWQPTPILKGEICQRCNIARVSRLAGGIWKSVWQMAPGEEFRARTTAPRCREVKRHEGSAA